MNVIFGAGGFAKEVCWLVNDSVREGSGLLDIDAFVADDAALNIGHYIHGVQVISESEFFDYHRHSLTNVFIAVGSPQLKQLLYERCITQLDKVVFPALLHPSIMRDTRPEAISIGLGTIVCAGSIVTTDVRVGDFVHLNLNCTVGHDAEIGSFSTLSPGVHVSGHVRIGHSCFIGTGAVILENIDIPDNTVIGAGATVVKTLDVPGTYVGTPARLRQ